MAKKKPLQPLQSQITDTQRINHFESLMKNEAPTQKTMAVLQLVLNGSSLRDALDKGITPAVAKATEPKDDADDDFDSEDDE